MSLFRIPLRLLISIYFFLSNRTVWYYLSKSPLLPSCVSQQKQFYTTNTSSLTSRIDWKELLVYHKVLGFFLFVFHFLWHIIIPITQSYSRESFPLLFNSKATPGGCTRQVPTEPSGTSSNMSYQHKIRYFLVCLFERHFPEESKLGYVKQERGTSLPQS